MDICRSSSEISSVSVLALAGCSAAEAAGLRNSIMGNSHLASKCHLRGDSLNEPPVAGANGILARIPGQYVSAVLSLLPPAALTQELHQEVEMDAGPAGKVRFFVKSKWIAASQCHALPPCLYHLLVQHPGKCGAPRWQPRQRRWPQVMLWRTALSKWSRDDNHQS